ncbi:MAG: hypothetical protein ACFFCS_07555 [Candidatus Hodarchaeota archaeon]
MKLTAVWNKAEVAKYKDGWKGLAGKLELYMKAELLENDIPIEKNRTEVKNQVGKGTYEIGYDIIQKDEIPDNFTLKLELWEQDHEPTPDEICDSVACYEENPVMSNDQMQAMRDPTQSGSMFDFGKLVSFVANNLNQDDLYGRWIFTFKKSGSSWNVEVSPEKGASAELGDSVVKLNEPWKPASLKYEDKNNDVKVDIELKIEG